MPALSEHINVHTTALAILKRKGFRYWYNEKINVFCAEKDGWDFMADSPCALLGVISIYEFQDPKEFKEYWWRIDDPTTQYKDIPRVAPEYVHIWDK